MRMTTMAQIIDGKAVSASVRERIAKDKKIHYNIDIFDEYAVVIKYTKTPTKHKSTN